MTRDLAQLLHDYKIGKYDGIPNELLHYVQAHPELYVDRSGNNLAPTDPNFRFFNPDPEAGDIDGSNWFPNDPRNSPKS